MNLVALIMGPIVSAVATEILKSLAELTGSEWPALSTKMVNALVALILAHLPPTLVPVLAPIVTGIEPTIQSVVNIYGAQFLHDLATLVARVGGIVIPPLRSAFIPKA